MTSAPARIGKYRIERLLALGGMGEVFLAKLEGPGGFTKPVVIKRILPHFVADPEFVKMFLTEAKVAAVLSHPNLVQIFDFGEEAGSYFIAMEYVAGRNARDVLKSTRAAGQPFPVEVAGAIAVRALRGLQYAHEQRLLHRDISPENVLVGFTGAVKVVDFGIAKQADAPGDTQPSVLKGKIAYLSPEQIRTGKADGRSDLYAVGVMLYELLAGSVPFEATTDAARVPAILKGECVPLVEKNPAVPAKLCAIIEKAMHVEPKQRFATADELERARRQAQSDAATSKGTEARYRAAEAGSRTEDISVARARLMASEARAAQARASLERLIIRAPIDGEVLQVKVREGELYSFQGTEPLLVMGDTRKLRVRMDVDERDIARVKVGAEAYVTADAFGARRFDGQVVEIGRRFGRKNVRTDDPVERNDTKVLEVVIELRDTEPLVPGQRVVSSVAASANAT